MREYQDIASVVGQFSILLNKVLYDKTTGEDILEDGKKIAEGIAEQMVDIQESDKDIKDIMKEFADRFIGWRYLVSGLLDSEAVLKGLKATFGNITELPLKSLQILSKVITEANLSASKVAFGQIEDLMKIREKLLKRGGNVHKIVQQIYQKDDKGKIVNSLIYRYSKEFYDLIKANSEEGQRKKSVITDNINIEAYKEEAKKTLDERISRLNFMYKDDDDKREDLILQEQRKWDITRKDFNGWTNYLIKRFPLEKWHSAEYETLRKDKELLELYDFIRKINDEAEDVGYISGAVSHTFLPFIKRNTAEALAWGMNPSVVANWFDKLTVNVNDKGRGHRNELTGDIEHSIPKYYTYDFTRQEDGTHDNSDIS